jgi:hypothetical protein
MVIDGLDGSYHITCIETLLLEAHTGEASSRRPAAAAAAAACQGERWDSAQGFYFFISLGRLGTLAGSS